MIERLKIDVQRNKIHILRDNMLLIFHVPYLRDRADEFFPKPHNRGPVTEEEIRRLLDKILKI